MLATTIETRAAPGDVVHVADLGALLERHPQTRLLSLDCFDTILWRHVAKPTDVFYDLQHDSAFAGLRFDGRTRERAEQMARELAFVRHGTSEVTLAQIYCAAVPTLDEATIAAMEEAELQAELRACYAHPQAVQLLCDARRRGIEVMIVSDTYLSETQLRRLLAAHLPEDAYRAIRRVVVSSAHGLGKSAGLFGRLIERLRLAVRTMLHVGDNRIADFTAPRDTGIAAVHLVHSSEAVARMAEQRATALKLLDPGVHQRRALLAPYHGVQALAPHDGDIARILGVASLGPMLHAFSSWLIDRKHACERAGRRVKLAFLLRDGYMPWRACEALAGEPVGAPIYLSRYAAFAASFRSVEDIDRYLALFVGSRHFDAMLKQLLLDGAEAAAIKEAVERSTRPLDTFLRQVHRPETVRRILERSAAYRARLKRYLERELGLEAGDTLVFVDLGYVGTAQRVLAPLMREDWGVDLLGWYFMCTPEAGGADDRSGMIDATRYEAGAIDALLPFVSLLENLCTTTGGSVEDYAEDGSPVIAQGRTKGDQSERVQRIQTHALHFVTNAAQHFAALQNPPAHEALRDAALAEFGRMAYFPDREELAHYEQFALELNLGTERTIQLHDAEKSLLDLQRHGIFYATRRGSDARINTPHELRAAGLELSLAMLTTYRFGLAFARDDWSFRAEPFTVLLLQGQRSSRQTLQAHHTHDGCFRLVVPLGDGTLDVGVLPPENMRTLQLVDARVVRVNDLGVDSGSDDGLDVSGHLVLDGLEHLGDGVLRRFGPTSLLLLPGGTVQGHERMALDLVVRPLHVEGLYGDGGQP